jgi:hypothetical protein
MTASLASFQSDLGRALLGEDVWPIDSRSAGFRFTMKVRRSWCEGRSTIAAREVLTLLPEEDRQRLVGEYVDQGGGLEWFLATESEKIMAFLAPRLPDPSHALTLCRMAQALAVARLGAATFIPPRLRSGMARVDRGAHASLVWFHADPAAVMIALKSGEAPPVGPPDHPVVFAPGAPGLFRPATEAEAELWARLPADDPPPALAAPLLQEGALTYLD